jgi:NAD(P)-dependent dehydrogenase (short-subunit alcohol dehydrogenase family)
MRFAGKVAVVTGGASGIGRALGRRLASDGARVVLADVDAEGVSRAAEEIGAVGRVLDVRDRAAFAALVGDVVGEHGRLDLLFNNAGIAPGGPTAELPASVWDDVLGVNLGGVVNGVLAAWPVFVRQGGGHLVNTASGAGLAGPPMVAAYSASKFGVVGLGQSLRAEGAALGIRVTTICPGAVDTPILDAPSASLTGREVMDLVGLRPMPADRAADVALRAVARNRGLVVMPPKAKAAWWASRLSPRLGDALGRSVARRLRAQLD